MAYQEQDASELEAIRRRRAIAEAMMSRSAQPIEVQQGGKYTVPISPFQGIAKLAEAYFGRQGAESADADAKGVETRQGDRRKADIGRISEALTSQPALAAPADVMGGGPGRPELPPDQNKVIQALIAAEAPELQAQGLDMQIKSNIKKPAEPYSLKANERRFDGNNVIIAEGPTPPPKSGGGKYGLAYVPISENMEQQYETGLDGRVDMTKPVGVPVRRKTGANVNVSTVVDKGDSKYVETRLEDGAKKTSKLDDAAALAWKDLQTLERFLGDSKKGAEGSLQPIYTAAENLLSSFGYSSENLRSVKAMEAAVSDLVVTRMSEMGSHGFTNTDREVLEKSFPRIATDSAAREAVAKVLIRAKRKTINEFENRRKEEVTAHPALTGRINQPVWFNEYLDAKKLGAAKEKYKKP